MLHKKGFGIILIGHKNHPEVIGTMGQLPSGSIKLIETSEDVKKLDVKFTSPITDHEASLSVDDTAEIIFALKDKFKNNQSYI